MVDVSVEGGEAVMNGVGRCEPAAFKTETT